MSIGWEGVHGMRGCPQGWRVSTEAHDMTGFTVFDLRSCIIRNRHEIIEIFSHSLPSIVSKCVFSVLETETGPF